MTSQRIAAWSGCLVLSLASLAPATWALEVPSRAWIAPLAAWSVEQGTSAQLDLRTEGGEDGEVPVPTDAWLELTPLESDRRSRVVRLAERDAAVSRAVSLAGLAEGATLACAGGASFAVTCQELYVELGDAPVVTIERGVPLRGRYLVDGEPVEGARVAILPADLRTARPFTMPLGKPGSVPVGLEALTVIQVDGMPREVMTDEEGGFRLPPIAAGRYRLETLLPTGRVHHAAPFDVPTLDDARARLGGRDDDDLIWTLEDFDLRGGLRLEILAVDSADRPLAGVAVRARHGRDVRDAVFYEATTDAEGRALLDGFEVDRPVSLHCSRPGFLEVEREEELVPVLATCTMIRLATVFGQASGFDGLAPPGTLVSLRALDDEPSEVPEALVVWSEADRFHAQATRDANLAFEDPRPAPPSGLREIARDAGLRTVRSVGVNLAGRWALRDVAPGRYEVLAVAPAHEPTSIEIEVGDGERLDAGPLFLRAAGRFEGLVVDEHEGSPVTGAVVTVREPRGSGGAATDAEGRFALSLPAQEAWRLEVVAEGYVPGHFAVAPNELEGGAPLELALRRGGWILAVVWDAETDQPCRGCRVEVSGGGGSHVTDRQGEAFIGPLEAGRYRVDLPAVDHLGSTVIERPGADERWAEVEVGDVDLVWFGARSRALRVRFDRDLTPDWSLSGRSRIRRQRALSEADGSFALTQEPDERLDLYLERFDPESGGLLEVLQASITARENGEPDVDLSLPTTELRARALIDGVPAAGVPVRLVRLQDRLTAGRGVTDPEGRLLLPHVQPGVYALDIGERTVSMISLRVAEILDLGEIELTPGF